MRHVVARLTAFWLILPLPLIAGCAGGAGQRPERTAAYRAPVDPPQDQAAPIDEALAIPASARAGAAADGNATGIDDAASTASTAARTISASALVFRPAIAAAGLDLDRGIRRPSAFIGYEGPITEYYSVLTIDRQYSGAGPFGYGWGYGNAYLDRYERHAITEKVGILHR